VRQEKNNLKTLRLCEKFVVVKDMLNNGSEHRWVELTDFCAFYALSV
jgi:hypothetical protein